MIETDVTHMQQEGHDDQPNVHVAMRRLVAGLIDLIVLSLIQIWLGITFGIVRPTSGLQVIMGAGMSAFFSSAATIDPMWLLLSVVVYFFLQEALLGTTVGKMLMGLCVVDLNGRRISGRMALVRNVLRLIDAWPGLYIVGLIVARMSPLYQRLGDRVAHTLVVEASSVPLARYSRPAMLRRLLLLVSIATLFAAFCLSFSYYERPPLVIESWKNINNTYGFGLAAPLPPCGQVAYVFDNYTLGQSIDFYHLGQPQWKSDMMTYPIEYRLKGGNQTCNSSITLKWYGFLSGGWEVYHIGSQSVDFNAQGNHI